MNKLILALCFNLTIFTSFAQEVYPFDTTHWEITARAHVFENFAGEDAIYLQGGFATLKDVEFLNGTIEFDIYITDRRGFPGVYFRAFDNDNMESFYIRPHQSGKPDANQVAPIINGLTAWQLYFGEAYSFNYTYQFNRWTHVRLVVNNDKAQIFLDDSKQPNLSWILKHKPQAGKLAIGGGGEAMHYANFKVSPSASTIVDFKTKVPEVDEGIISSWSISDKFVENVFTDPAELAATIKNRKWEKTIEVEENNAANISWAAKKDNSPKNTVFAKITINADQAQTKLFQFGYSDRIVVILNGKPLYRGDNKYRTRDYRYLGTIGLFDSVYLDLKKGENTLLLAVSEDFGGWGVTGKFPDKNGIQVK